MKKRNALLRKRKGHFLTLTLLGGGTEKVAKQIQLPRLGQARLRHRLHVEQGNLSVVVGITVLNNLGSGLNVLAAELHKGLHVAQLGLINLFGSDETVSGVDVHVAQCTGDGILATDGSERATHDQRQQHQNPHCDSKRYY